MPPVSFALSFAPLNPLKSMLLIYKIYVKKLFFFYCFFRVCKLRHFRGVSRVDFRGVFFMGWRMVAIATSRLARTRIHLWKSPHAKNLTRSPRPRLLAESGVRVATEQNY